MNFYNFTNYRDLLKQAVEDKKAMDSSFTYQSLAEKMEIQKSYLSKVIAGGAELNSDQMYLASEALGWSVEQRKYAEVLLEYNRAEIQARRHELEKEMSRLRSKKTVSVAPLNADLFYLDAASSLVLAGLRLSKFQKDPQGLAESLGISNQRLGSILELLVKLGRVVREGKLFCVAEGFRSTTGVEPRVLELWKSQNRHETASMLQNGKLTDGAICETLIVAVSREAKERLALLLTEFIKECKAAGAKNDPREVLQINIDLISRS